MYRQKRKFLPTTSPKSLEEAINQVGNRTVLTNRYKTFCHVNKESKIIFLTTKSNIQYLYHNSSILVAHGTIFYVCSNFFFTSFIPHMFIAGPCAGFHQGGGFVFTISHNTHQCQSNGGGSA